MGGLIGALFSCRGWVERGGAEGPEDVVGAPGEFARDGQRGAGVREPARLERVIVVVIGTALVAGTLRGLVERPAQGERSLAG